MRNSLRLKIVLFLIKKWEFFFAAVDKCGDGVGMLTPNTEMLPILLENIIFNRPDFREMLKDALGHYLNKYIIERDEFIKTITE